MKKIFTLAIMFAAVAMVGCCGNTNKKAAEAEAAPACTENCATCETPCENAAPAEAAPAEVAVEAPAEAPAVAPAE